MNRLVLLVVLVASLGASAPARADDDAATRYHVSLGDSLAAGGQPPGAPADEGYADQLHATLVAADPKLELAEAVAFLHAHKGKVALVTINVGFNDLLRFDAQFNVISCFLEPEGCTTRFARLEANLAAILGELRAAGPRVPIVAMTYYNVFEPLGDPQLNAFAAAFNRVLARTYAAAGVPVADVAGAFEGHVCAWTWFCTLGDLHPNRTGYTAIAQAFLDALPAANSD